MVADMTDAHAVLCGVLVGSLIWYLYGDKVHDFFAMEPDMTDAELAALARAATPGMWGYDEGDGIGSVLLRVSGADGAYIASWSPERALAALTVIEAVRNDFDAFLTAETLGDLVRPKDALRSALVKWDAL
jgi:hypothetical protein